jgi:hypothetical protein
MVANRRQGVKTVKDRDTLFREFQMLAAGHATKDVIAAMTDSLASMVAFAANDREHAELILSDLRSDMSKAVTANWDQVRQIRARASSRGGKA